MDVKTFDKLSVADSPVVVLRSSYGRACTYIYDALGYIFPIVTTRSTAIFIAKNGMNCILHAMFVKETSGVVSNK